MQKELMKNFKTIGKIFSNKKKEIFFLLFSTILIGVLESIGVGILLPFFDILFSQKSNFENSLGISKYIFSFLSNYEFNKIVIILSSLIILIFIIKNAFIAILNYLNLHILTNMQNDLHQIVLHIFHNKDYEDIQNLKSSDILRDTISEPKNVIGFISSCLGIIVEILTISILISIIIFTKPSGMISVVPILISATIIFYLSFGKLKKWGAVRFKSASNAIQSLVDPFTNSAEVRILKLENFFIKLFSMANIKSLKTTLNLNFVQSLNKHLFEIFFIFIIFLVLIILASDVKFNLYDSLPTFASLIVISLRVIPSANKLVNYFQSLSFLSKSMNHFCYIISDNADLESKNKNPILLDDFKNFSLKNLNFKYKDSKNMIIENLSFDMQKGEKTAIFGESGSGKSTLGKIISGLLQPTSGKILFNNAQSIFFGCRWGAKLGYIPPQSFLWEGTLLNNITLNFYSEEFDKEKLDYVIRVCKLEGVISNLEEKFFSRIKDGGSNFSSGQVQRIAIARHLYHDPDLLILDEATNALDKNMQKEILLEILKIKEMTVLAISHDPEVISGFPKIYKFFNGNIKNEDFI